jgi:Amt family ammonium transporter
MNMQTIAEFVEDEAILHRIEEIGIDFAQGYYLGRPEQLSNWKDNSSKTS